MKHLTTPMEIGSLRLHNRLVMPPMATAKADEEGRVTQALVDYYLEKTQGGCIGLVITEHSYISPEGKASRNQVSIAQDDDIPGLRRIASAIHQNGSKAIAQINHAGGQAKSEVTGHKSISASAVKMPNQKTDSPMLPQEMTQADIRRVVEQFAKAAARAKAAGFDGVEIHSAHGYLLNQYYSPLTNHRRDDYAGNSLSGRIRLHLEVIQAVRAQVGQNYPIALRLGACDYMEGGATIQDSVQAAQEFERAGVALLDISGGFCGYRRPEGAPEQGYFGEITQAIKETVSIPVILTGGITDVQAAKELLQNGKADLIGVGRALMQDSRWAKKALLGPNWPELAP